MIVCVAIRIISSTSKIGMKSFDLDSALLCYFISSSTLDNNEAQDSVDMVCSNYVVKKWHKQVEKNVGNENVGMVLQKEVVMCMMFLQCRQITYPILTLLNTYQTSEKRTPLYTPVSGH